jgi:hypothetical protein
MAAQYQVVAECAHVTLDGASGRFVTLLLKGAMVPAEAPELERLVRDGYVAKTGGDESGGVDASGIPAAAYTADVPAAITTTPVARSEQQREADREAADKVRADAELADKRAAARAKLPEGGAEPDGRAGKDVWVEYLVSRGQRYGDVKDVDKAELQKLAKQQS